MWGKKMKKPQRRVGTKKVRKDTKGKNEDSAKGTRGPGGSKRGGGRGEREGGGEAKRGKVFITGRRKRNSDEGGQLPPTGETGEKVGIGTRPSRERKRGGGF